MTGYSSRYSNSRIRKACRKDQQLEADQAAVERERQELLNDTQALHDSTQQLRQLRDAVAQDKQAVLVAMRHLEAARAEIQEQKAASAAQTAAAAIAGKQIGELRMKLSEKRAQLSNETVKVDPSWSSCQSGCELVTHVCATFELAVPNRPAFPAAWKSSSSLARFKRTGAAAALCLERRESKVAKLRSIVGRAGLHGRWANSQGRITASADARVCTSCCAQRLRHGSATRCREGKLSRSADVFLDTKALCIGVDY